MYRLSLAWMLVALVLVGCSFAPTQTPNPSSSLSTPTTRASSSHPPQPSQSLEAIRPCRPGEVAIGGALLRDGLGTDGFVLYDVSPSDCTISGRVAVQILDTSGSPLAVQIEPWETNLDFGAGLLAGQPTPAPGQGLYPGWVGVQLGWSNWCGAPWTGGSLVVQLPSIGTLTAPLPGSSAPPCTDRTAPSTLIVGPIISPR